MIICWEQDAWQDYLYWQHTDKKVLKRINLLIKESTRTPFEGIGSPEPLKHNRSGYWSRRIDREHRFVYKLEENHIYIVQCRYHY